MPSESSGGKRRGPSLSKLKAVMMLIGFLLFLPLAQVEAQPSVFSTTIISPTQGQTFLDRSVTVNARITLHYWEFLSEDKYSFQPVCYVDGQPYGVFGRMSVSVEKGDMVKTLAVANCEIVLNGLTQGEHTVEIKGTGSASWLLLFGDVNERLHDSVVFFVNLGVAPSVSIYGLYTSATGEAIFNVITNRADALVSYSLDRLANVTLPQSLAVQMGSAHSYRYNVSLSGLADGLHEVKVFAVDVLGNAGVAVSDFRINTTSPTPPAAPAEQPELPITALVAGAATVAAICLGLVAYFLRRKSKRRSEA
jgi:hypothetical protein